MFAPAFAKRRVVAVPIPDVTPVMKKFFSENYRSISFSIGLFP
jgi:hypothetical protein